MLLCISSFTLLSYGGEDVFGKSGPAKELLEYYNLNAKGIVEKVRVALSMKIDN